MARFEIKLEDSAAILLHLECFKQHVIFCVSDLTTTFAKL
jgi:hypothetical protein